MSLHDEDDVTSETMCWRLGLKYLYQQGTITADEFEDMYSPECVFVPEGISMRENHIAHLVTDVVSDKSKLTELITSEFSLDKIGTDRKLMKREWTLYLRECMAESLITETEFIGLDDMIKDGDNPLSASERIAAIAILEKLQLRSVKQEPTIIRYLDDVSSELQVEAVKIDPTLIEDIDNPSFDALMIANGIT
jgi:hypothetical protein